MWPTSQALELLVGAASAISVDQAQARDKLWTPGKEDQEVEIRLVR